MNKRNQQRELWIDVMRAFACLMVLFCHAPQPYTTQPGVIFVGINNFYGMAWGPMLFFMISGACILYKEEPAFSFFKRRFSRVIIPTIIWSIIYIFMECYIWHDAPSVSFTSRVLSIPFGPQYGMMWFMYAIISIYLMTPIITPWLSKCSKLELETYLGMWIIVLILPYLSLFNNNTFSIVQKGGILFYFGSYLWIAVFGYYCRKYIITIKINYKFLLLCILILTSPLILFMIRNTIDKNITSHLTINTIANTSLVFIVIQNIQWKGMICKIIEFISKYSFGIYLTHMLFMSPFRKWISIFNLNYIIQIPLTAFTIGACSLLLTWLISKFPHSKYIIG